MARLRVIHWNAEEAAPLLALCRSAGYGVDYEHGGGPAMVKATRKPPVPDAVVIDLTRLASHGREVGVALRNYKALRSTPIVFVDGEEEKVEKTRERVPGAYFCTRAQLRRTLKKALSEERKGEFPAAAPMMELYRSRFTFQKLGVKPGMSLGVVDPPRDYLAALGPLPEGVEIVENPEAPEAVTVWFVHELDPYLDALSRMRRIAHRTKLWVAWRKGAKNGITQNSVREAAREFGLVDYKICAIDGRWSGMLFALRKT
jgi:CheY-like chemotaxis protein